MDRICNSCNDQYIIHPEILDTPSHVYLTASFTAMNGNYAEAGKIELPWEVGPKCRQMYEDTFHRASTPTSWFSQFPVTSSEFFFHNLTMYYTASNIQSTQFQVVLPPEDNRSTRFEALAKILRTKYIGFVIIQGFVPNISKVEHLSDAGGKLLFRLFL